MDIKVYGIKNCNTMKKTFQLLEQEGIAYEFLDYKKNQPSKELLSGFVKKSSLDLLINKKGTTFRKLSDDQKALLNKEETALPVMMESSSMIKRPILQFPDGELVIGLQEEDIINKAKAGKKDDQR